MLPSVIVRWSSLCDSPSIIGVFLILSTVFIYYFPQQQKSLRLFSFCFSISILSSFITDVKKFRHLHTWQHQHARYRVEGKLGHTRSYVYGVKFLNKRLLAWQTPKRFNMLLYAFAFTLISALVAMSCFSGLQQIFFFAAWVLYFPIFGALYADTRINGHMSLMLPHIFFFLTVCNNDQVAVAFIKPFVGCMYTGAGLCKLFRSGAEWANGSTIQYHLLRGLIIRPPRYAFVRQLVKWIISDIDICAAMSRCALGWELVSCIIFMFPLEVQTMWALCGIGFHLSIWHFQGFDFISYWAPALLAFPFRAEPLSVVFFMSNTVWSTILLALASVYCCFGVVLALTIRELQPDYNFMPFTCCPMYSELENLFSSTSKTWRLTSVNTRFSGQVDCHTKEPYGMIWGANGFNILKRLPYHALCFSTPILASGSSGGLEVQTVVNFDASQNLMNSIVQASSVMKNREECEVWAPETVKMVISALEEVRRGFECDVQSLSAMTST